MQVVKIWPDIVHPPEKYCVQCGVKAIPGWDTSTGFDENTGKKGVTSVSLELVCPRHGRIALFVWNEREEEWVPEPWGNYGMV